jgi:hypothetical protein
MVHTTLMVRKDLHSALKTEILREMEGGGVHFGLVRHQWSREDMGFSLHADPRTFSSYGVQKTDFLPALGFQHLACAFLKGNCYARWVPEGFDVDAFASDFQESYSSLTAAEGALRECGLVGPTIFEAISARSAGDGHLAAQSKRLKDAEDENFLFAFTWIEGQQKGWTTHYRAKEQPLSPEIAGVFNFLGLRTFEQCPEFEFEECAWRFTSFDGRDAFDSNADYAYSSFDAHPGKFSLGIEHLLIANRLVERQGMPLLHFSAAPAERREVEIRRRMSARTASPMRRPIDDEEHFDVAISFAGSEREYAEGLAVAVKEAGFSVFYDNFYKATLWGKDLPVLFDDIYRNRSGFCVIFVSTQYAERMWTNHERRSAQARAMQQRAEYILPIDVDGSDLPGMPNTVGRLSLAEHSIDEIATMLIEKLRSG